MWRRPSAVATRRKSAAAASMTSTFSPSRTVPSPVGARLHRELADGGRRTRIPQRGRATQSALGERPQKALALLVGAAQRQRQAGNRVREQRRGGQRVAHLLEEHRQLDDAEPLPTPLLGERQPGPAELGHLVPVGLLEAVLALGQLANPLGLVARGEEVMRGRLDRLLLVGEIEVHGQLQNRQRIFGRPSTRSAMMFLRMSVVPPSIELARERRKLYCQAPPASACSSPRASGA